MIALYSRLMSAQAWARVMCFAPEKEPSGIPVMMPYSTHRATELSQAWAKRSS